MIRETPDGAEIRLVAIDIDADLATDLRAAEGRRLRRAGATTEAAKAISGVYFPSSLTAALGAGQEFLRRVEQAIDEPDEKAVLPLGGLKWAPAIDPPAMLDFAAFEQHLVNAHARGKKELGDVFYERPVYYKMDPNTVIGHDDVVPWASESSYMDYELELGLVVGTEGSDLEPATAQEHLLGVTVLNDFTARDVQAREMPSGFGPAKGKDFATALGPWVTTLDELDINDLTMVARVNGEEWSRGSTSTLTWSIGELLAYASRSGKLVPGEVIGTGTVGLGCGLELYKSLQPGDVVELEIEGIGLLRNTIGKQTGSFWQPSPKQRTASPTLPPRPTRSRT
ncbi:fumarylacetoacetate hydrolase family protein [Mycolicibacterium agri]|uniref:fumarylacetoacetate hydrolase family protein n=1 Tax=Mycolicibacterium agri TaxID=36811 RepID=UPI0013D3D7E3|nr:fumarylacetoacetate hydrolase family protein [Mycolicibacterium agri]